MTLKGHNSFVGLRKRKNFDDINFKMVVHKFKRLLGRNGKRALSFKHLITFSHLFFHSHFCLIFLKLWHSLSYALAIYCLACSN